MTEDWFDMIVALMDADARFMVVGAHALAIHGVPRATQDLDVWIDPHPANTPRVMRALAGFGAPVGDLKVTEEDLQRPDTVIQLGLPPNRIDLLTSVSGIREFEDAWRTRVAHEVHGRTVPFIGREALITNKLAAGRPRDLADAAQLSESGDTSADELT